MFLIIHNYFCSFADTVCITAGPKDCRDRVRVEDHEKNSTDEKASLIHVFYLDNGSRGKVPLSALV